MAAPTLMAPTSPPCALLAGILAAMKVVRGCQNLALAGSGDLVKGHAGEARDPWRTIKEPSDLALDGWPDLSWPRLKIPALQLASGAALVTHNMDPCPEMRLPTRAHPAGRKEGICCV